MNRFGSLASQLYNCEQGKEESVEKYLTRMTMLSSKLPGMNMNYKVVAIEKGLHSAIRSRVKEHQCDNMEDLTKWAILAEECEADRRGADRDVMKTVQEIQRDIREDLRKDLRDMIESTQLRSMTEHQASKASRAAVQYYQAVLCRTTDSNHRQASCEQPTTRGRYTNMEAVEVADGTQEVVEVAEDKEEVVEVDGPVDEESSREIRNVHHSSATTAG